MKLGGVVEDCCLDCEFPLPKGGGPIEASSPRSGPLPRWPRLHRRKEVAPLKRDLRGPGSGQSGRFHRRKEVAPLKRGGDDGASLLGPEFPPPKGGGPIEALPSHRSTRGILTRVHRRKEVAPLKQQHVVDDLGGLPGFHCRKEVAPLKPGSDVPRQGGHRGCFHFRKAVAPLKLVVGAGAAAVDQVVSTAERRWPH